MENFFLLKTEEKHVWLKEWAEWEEHQTNLNAGLCSTGSGETLCLAPQWRLHFKCVGVRQRKNASKLEQTYCAWHTPTLTVKLLHESLKITSLSD